MKAECLASAWKTEEFDRGRLELNKGLRELSCYRHDCCLRANQCQFTWIPFTGTNQEGKNNEDLSFSRTVKNLHNGIETLTESDVPEVAATIQEHVEAMYDRMETVNPIRMRDPLFREIFSNTDKIEMNVEHTDHGVRVTETSEDAYVAKLLQEHARVVSLFIKNGYAELPKNHAAPER